MLFDRDIDLRNALHGALVVQGNDVQLIDADKLRADTIERLVYNAQFHASEDVRYYCSWLIREAAAKLTTYPSSLHGLYEAMAAGRIPRFAVPVFRLHVLTYDAARACLRAARERNCAALVFELLNHESRDWLSPLRYATAIIAAAIKEAYTGPLFLKSAAAQIVLEYYRDDRDAEMDRIRAHIDESLSAGLFNIDIDTSPLYDPSRATYVEQQLRCASEAAELASFTRNSEAHGLIAAVGVEIEDFGDPERTVHQLRGFMDGFLVQFRNRCGWGKGLVKVTVPTSQLVAGAETVTGPNLALLRDVGEVARREYAMAMGVRPRDGNFADATFGAMSDHAINEVNLGSVFDDAILDHTAFSNGIKETMYHWINTELRDQRRAGQSDIEFYQSMRYRAIGPFNRMIWDQPSTQRDLITADLTRKAGAVIETLHAANTVDVVRESVDIEEIKAAAPRSGYEKTAESTLSDIMTRLRGDVQAVNKSAP